MDKFIAFAFPFFAVSTFFPHFALNFLWDYFNLTLFDDGNKALKGRMNELERKWPQINGPNFG